MHVDIIKLHVNMIMLRGQNYATTHKKNTATGVISKLIDIQQEENENRYTATIVILK